MGETKENKIWNQEILIMVLDLPIPSCVILSCFISLSPHNMRTLTFPIPCPTSEDLCVGAK